MAAVALALGQAVSVQAIDPQELLAPIVGPVLILPHVSLSESYDDNVFLLSDEQGKIDDLVTTLSPGIGLQFGENILDSNYIGLDYTLSQQWYAENNETQHRQPCPDLRHQLPKGGQVHIHWGRHDSFGQYPVERT